ncbi:structural protein [Cellulophaga phage phi4:1]|uniref:Structural protein n=5 Tax=Lightbulbvirus TaxID=1918522 RepID=A0A0S2MWH8_9CAUD|nr:structural protein [Cellulophaga phage phi4:1]YP_008241554.1 structural protein [Cellulophaga phage phi17:2]ALO80066.1 structural protein [Cellulophaga phage phi4:1_13]ALO80263.1 structural protein [Cellulophaga phage phi4:1_18]ALO80462.1 structural protein [Cellulophaga phage phi17:2_18]AGO47592.1 structural protein [Cellulophaga phage phi17:2]AGO49470.1 structural protein [Cellulophaga phage phi4:1]
MKFKDILLVLAILALIFFGYSWYYSNLHRQEAERMEQIRLVRNDKLREINKGYYEKLVADTLTKSEMREKIKELGIDLKNAQLAQKIVFVPVDKKTVITEVVKTDTTLTFEDYYPQKDNFFVKHTTGYNTKTNVALGEFNFNPITLALGIAQQSDGTYKVATKLPEFFKINSIDVQSLPLTPVKKDVFGVLVGVDYVQPLHREGFDIDINSYIRINKVYIGGGYRTDNTLKGGFKIEF